MGPVLVILIIIGGGIIWLLCSSLFRPIGSLFNRLWSDAKETMFDDKEEENIKK